MNNSAFMGRSPAEHHLQRLQTLAGELTGATTLEQAAQAVLISGCDALGANAGSVALLNEESSEFVTLCCLGYTADIVQRYRRYPVDTPLPNAEAARNNQSIFLSTVAERNERYPHLAGSTISGGRGALAALPLITAGQAMGAVVWSFPDERSFTEEERTLLVTISYLCALAVERLRREAAQRALREVETRWKALFDYSHDAIGVAAHGKIQYVNQAFATMLGFDAPDQLVGLSTFDVVAHRDRPRLVEIAQRRLEGQEQSDVYQYRAIKRDGTEIDVENRVTFYKQEDGSQMTLVIARDVTARNRSIQGQRLLARAGQALAGSLDVEETLQNIATLIVPDMADWCTIHLADDTGTLRQVALTHVDANKLAAAREVGRRYSPAPHSDRGIYAVLRTGKSEWMNDIPEELLRAVAQDEDHARILLATGMRSYLCVALAARGKRLGTLTFIGAETGHRYGPEDVALAEQLAQRAALAVENARLYQAAQREIEERSKAEQQVNRLNESLEARIEEFARLLEVTRGQRTELEGLNARLRQAMTETHHRVKNNLQVMIALIDVQLGEHGDNVPRSELVRLSSHVRTLAALHDLLTQQAKADATANSVSAREVLEKVAGLNELTATRPIRLLAADIELTTRRATGLALVFNELITNSIKHGQGKIRAEFIISEQGVLQVSDEGKGFPVGFKPDPTRSTGLELVETIVRWDLGGSITYGKGEYGGASVRVTFPLGEWPVP
jgi:PAS domain S-box-containing protein